MAAFEQAMRSCGVGRASLQPMYRWASPFEGERKWTMHAALQRCLDRHFSSVAR